LELESNATAAPVLHFGVAAQPTAPWTAEQLQEAFPWDSAPSYLSRDRDGIFGVDFIAAGERYGEGFGPWP
jgi:hypothetical protein